MEIAAKSSRDKSKDGCSLGHAATADTGRYSVSGQTEPHVGTHEKIEAALGVENSDDLGDLDDKREWNSERVSTP